MTLPLLALIAATLFAGAALYISLVEQPARLCLSDGPMLAQWQPSYKAALPIQSGLAIIGGGLGLIAAFHSHEWRWLAGSVLLLANWPFTLLGIMPTNKRLMAMAADDPTADVRQLLLYWGKLHAVRSALGSLSAAMFAWAILATG